MIKHIVMFKFNEENKINNIQKAKDQLELLAKITGNIKEFEVGFNVATSPFAYDLILVSAFDTEGSLGAYAQHAKHQEFLQFIVPVTCEIAETDYIV